jgi:tetratricopeptide (TPR) repeat protein
MGTACGGDPVTEDRVDEAIRWLDTSSEHREGRRLAPALADARQALAILEAECGPEHPDVANALLAVGRCHEDATAYDQAELCYRRAAAIMDTYPDEPDEMVARLRVQAHTEVGQIERILGRLDDARATLRAATALAEDRLGPDDPDTGVALNAFGMVCKYGGWFAEGKAAYQRALAIIEHNDGPTSSNAASVWHNLGGLAFDAGDYVTAEGPARRAVEIREAALGADHPDVAADVAALAAIVAALDRANEAETLYQRALAVLEHTQGADYDLAILHNNLGLAAAERSDTTAAEHHYRRALAIKERLLGPDHPDIAITLQNLGVLAANTGHPAEAHARLERALAIFQASLCRNHPKVTDCRAALASL